MLANDGDEITVMDLDFCKEALLANLESENIW